QPALSPSDIVTLPCPAIAATPARPSMRLAAAYTVTVPSRSVQPRIVVVQRPSEAGADERGELEMATSMRAVHIGKVTHALVERITADGIDAWPASRVASERAWIERRLRTAGAIADELTDCCRAVEEALAALLHDERG